MSMEESNSREIPYQKTREDLNNAIDILVREDIVKPVETILGMALTEMDGEDEYSLAEELNNERYGVKDTAVEDGLLEFTLEYEHNTDITVGALVVDQGQKYNAAVNYVKTRENKISDSFIVEPS